jgi:uncharacterized Ntn-hydrolase superfamily protein
MLLRTFFLLSLTLAVVSEEREQPPVATSPVATSPVATFSIVAVDPETGEIGVGVQSKIVGVGSIVPFAKAGVGAVATQSFANTGYGPLGLRAFTEGIAPEKVIQILTADDPMRDRRQVGVINAKGKAANFTGKGCHGWAGGIVGVNFAIQGNILTGPEVIEEMARAFEETDGVLAERLIEALRAGQAAGGDSRGRQSAALLIVRDGWGYGGIDDRFRDIRIDEHETPIEELERIYRKHRNLFPRPE